MRIAEKRDPVRSDFLQKLLLEAGSFEEQCFITSVFSAIENGGKIEITIPGDDVVRVANFRKRERSADVRDIDG